MTREKANDRVYDYVIDQANRISKFKESYEEEHGVKLGSYPFNVDQAGFDVNAKVYNHSPEESLAVDIEQAIEEQVEVEMSLREGEEVQGMVDIEESLRRIEGQPHVDSAMDDLRAKIKAKDPSISDTDLNDAIVDVTDRMEQGDSRLNQYDLADSNGIKILPSKESLQLNSVQSAMDKFYEDSPRPSDEMEKLIEEAELEARSIDDTLNRILELEEQGIENPLAQPKVENAIKPADQQRNLLKDLYRKKRDEGLASKPSNDSLSGPDSGMDL